MHFKKCVNSVVHGLEAVVCVYGRLRGNVIPLQLAVSRTSPSLP